jgi:hypothetical protein
LPTYFEWLFLQPIENPPQKLVPAVICVAVVSVSRVNAACDSGAGARLGDFKSRVAGIGPQIGFFIPFFDRQAYLNLRDYSEFDATNRLEGWNAFITFSIEPPGEKVPAVANLR